MDEFLGKVYVAVKSENFEEYLTYIGLGYIQRKAVLTQSPSQVLIRNEDGSYSLSISAILFRIVHTFRLGEEHEETRADGVELTSIVTFDGNKLIQIQREKNGRTTRILREYFHDSMVSTITVDGFDKVVKRYHKAK